MKRTQISLRCSTAAFALVLALVLVLVLALAGCDQYRPVAPRSAMSATVTQKPAVMHVADVAQSDANANAAASSMQASDGVAMVVALPLPYTGTVLNRLADNGRASGIELAPAGALALPLSVSPTDMLLATERNFFGRDRRAWTLLRTASSNSRGLLAGHGVVGGRHLAWTWDGRPAQRRFVPAGYEIKAVVGPADDGSLAAEVYNRVNFAQEILSWQPGGSSARLYRNVQPKAGMQLIGIASNGLIAAIERDGILLTPKIYNGQWYPLPFDYLHCSCEARRVNARGQILMSPLPERGGNPHGYLVSRSGATLLPHAGSDTTYEDLNDLGDVVGNAGGRPIVILDGVLHDLNSYAGNSAGGWQFLSAIAINARRQILGAGLWQGQVRWYRLNLR